MDCRRDDRCGLAFALDAYGTACRHRVDQHLLGSAGSQDLKPGPIRVFDYASLSERAAGPAIDDPANASTDECKSFSAEQISSDLRVLRSSANGVAAGPGFHETGIVRDWIDGLPCPDSNMTQLDWRIDNGRCAGGRPRERPIQGTAIRRNADRQAAESDLPSRHETCRANGRLNRLPLSL